MEGYIKIFRDIREHWIWEDPVKLRCWLDMLLTVNSKPGKVNVGMNLYECGRGQAIRSLSTWAAQWGVNKDTARNFLKLLEKDGMISIEALSTPHTDLHGCRAKNTRLITRLTICNYESYQTNLHDCTHDCQPIAGQKTDSNNTITVLDNKNIDSNSIVKYCYSSVDFSFVDERFRESFNRWLAQKKRRSNYTYQAQELLDIYGKLLDLSGNDPATAAAIVGNAEKGNWADLYPLKQAKSTAAPTQAAPSYSSSQRTAEDEEYANRWKARMINGGSTL